MRCELKLVEIELQNFRLFEHIKVQFDDKLTVLISENGAGKTALLEGIAKALKVLTDEIITTEELQGNDYENLFDHSDIRFGEKKADIHISVKLLDHEYPQGKLITWAIATAKRWMVFDSSKNPFFSAC